MSALAELLEAIKQAPEADAPRRQSADLLIADDHPRGRWMHAQLDAADPSLSAGARERAAAQADAEFEAALTSSDQHARRDLARERPCEWTRVLAPDLPPGECAMRLVVPDLDPSGQLESVYLLRYARGMLTGVIVERGFDDDVALVASVLGRGPIREFGCPGPLLHSYMFRSALPHIHELRIDGPIDADTLRYTRQGAPSLRRVDLSRARIVGIRADFEAALDSLDVAWPEPAAVLASGQFPDFEATMAKVLDEEARAGEYDSSWSANPYSPERIADGLAVMSAVPYLIGTLWSGSTRERTWAVYALRRLGPAAGPEAAIALEQLGHHEALFYVDEPRARALGIHRRLGVRHKIIPIIAARGHGAMREHFELLLRDRDPDVVQFALGAGRYPDDSALTKRAREFPEQVPVVEVRALLDSADPRLRSGAANLLASLHLPEDAERVIDRLIDDAAHVKCRAASWLGSHPRSNAWIERVDDLDEIGEILRRRRCAGLGTDAELVRTRVLAALQAGPAAPGYDSARKRAIGSAANIVWELGDPSFAPALVDAIGPIPGARPREGEGPFDPLSAALASLGEAGLHAVHAVEFDEPDRQQRLGWMRDALRRPHPGSPALEHADARFIEGELETTIGTGAYDLYAKHLHAHPRSAAAAAQIAWIERGFGVWISPQRITWLRELGVAEDLLVELAERPPAILFGFSFGHPRLMEPDRVRVHADTAMQAGLFGIAAKYFGERWPAEADQARDAARMHIERARG